MPYTRYGEPCSLPYGTISKTILTWEHFHFLYNEAYTYKNDLQPNEGNLVILLAGTRDFFFSLVYVLY